MGLITLSEVKPGLKLGSDVQTLRGNVLLQKGKIILPKDVEVLRAFMIHQIDIEQEKVVAGGGSSSKGLAGASGQQLLQRRAGTALALLFQYP